MFTLIAYRTNGYCPSGSQASSDLDISYHDDDQSLLIEFLKFKKKEFDRRDYREYDAYEFTILENGRDLYDTNYAAYEDLIYKLNSVGDSDKVKWLQEEQQEKAEARLTNMRNQRKKDFAELVRIHERLGITG